MPITKPLSRRRGSRAVPLALAAFLATVTLVRFDLARAGEAPAGSAAAAPLDFVRDVKPILAQNCYKCHDATKKKGGLQLDIKAKAFAGGDSGDKAITPGDPEHSKLIHLVRGDDPKEVMPPKGKGERLTPEQVDVLTRWIKQGATWPDGADAVAVKATPDHWSFKKPVRPTPPDVKQKDWVKSPIDHFILARLEKEGLTPSAEADRYALVRRLSLDLTGLPPTPQEVKAFVEDKSTDAYEKLVDRLLASPAYGERWARMWMDLARYADSKGHGSDPLRTIWLYRDWVIKAFNANKPYDQFTLEQVAGDLLPSPTQDQLIATAFHRNTMTNDEGGTDDEEFRVVAVKDRANVTAQVWMGLTMGCAQCHTHKYDPITQREYYQFYGFFNETEDADRMDEQPLLEVWTEQQEQRKTALKAQVVKLEEQLKQDTPELRAGEQKWESLALEQERNWVVLDPSTFASAGGATLTEQPDHSLLASGKRPDAETYTIAAQTHLKNVTAVRVEALPDASLPMGGPGRADNGGFVLNSFKLTVAPAEPKPVAGRFVRIELPGRTKILSLAEVQAFSGGQNVAPKGTASQSSTAFEGDAKLAIDGNTDGQFSLKSTTHTAESDNPWWELDLGQTQPLEKLALWNRADNNLGSRLKDARVIVLDESRKPVWDATVGTAPSPSAEYVVGGPRTVALQNASADYWQTEGGDFSAAKAIDNDGGPKSGWAVSNQVGRPHAAVFETASDVGDGSGALLTFTISHTAPGASLGKFRLSVTTAPRSVRALPGGLASVLTIPEEKRGDDQKAELLAHYRTFSPELKPLRDQVAQATAQMAAIRPATVPVMRELPADKQRKTFVMVKGNFLAKGDEVKPAMLESFHPMPKDAPNNRLGVVKWLVCDDNPLTARVHVNRLWAQLFGLGLVETQEDFGTQGTPPSHPELLDWLATEFQQTLKWDQKAMLKRLVMSATYRQSSVVRPDAAAKDPRNRLLAHFPRLRVEAEMVRDQALAMSGLLSHKMLGPSVFPPQPDGLWQAAFNGERTWQTSAGEDRYRRGLYTFWRRTVPYPSMAAFDAPSRETCTVRRINSNTPLQAFVTLNDPVYVEAAQALARRVLKEGGGDADARARYALELCQGRPASAEQTKAVIDLYNAEAERYRTDKPAAEQLATNPLGPLPAGIEPHEAAAWTVVSNVLLNLDAVLTKG